MKNGISVGVLFSSQMNQGVGMYVRFSVFLHQLDTRIRGNEFHTKCNY